MFELFEKNSNIHFKFDQTGLSDIQWVWGRGG